MNRIKKTVICIALCMAMILGSSLTSFAASGNVSYGNYGITYSTSSSSVYMVARNTSDAYYLFDGTACCERTDGTAVYKYEISGGNGIDKQATCTLSTGPRVNCKFSNIISSYNRMSFKRTTDLTVGFSTLITFSYSI